MKKEGKMNGDRCNNIIREVDRSGEREESENKRKEEEESRIYYVYTVQVGIVVDRRRSRMKSQRN